MKHLVAAVLIGVLAYGIAVLAIPDVPMLPLRTGLIVALGLLAYAMGIQFGRLSASSAPASNVNNTPPVTVEKPVLKAEPAMPSKAAASARSDALNLLAAMQREARFLDFIKEPLDGYSDAQIGAAARTVHRDCGTVLERAFAPRPLLEREEGAVLEVPSGFDAAAYRLTGNVSGAAPYQGTLQHAGWRATKVELPTWTGSPDSKLVIAPAEVEIKG